MREASVFGGDARFLADQNCLLRDVEDIETLNWPQAMREALREPGKSGVAGLRPSHRSPRCDAGARLTTEYTDQTEGKPLGSSESSYHARHVKSLLPPGRRADENSKPRSVLRPTRTRRSEDQHQ
jgi:hypothetical protein